MATHQAEIARLIGDHLSGLAVQARQAGLDTLSYLIEMARLEAEQSAKPKRRL